MHKRFELLADYMENEMLLGFSTSQRAQRRKICLESLQEIAEEVVDKALTIVESKLLRGHAAVEELKKLQKAISGE